MAELRQYKCKILFVNGNLRIGGAEMSLVNLLNSFDYSMYSVDLILLQDGYDYESEIPSEVNIIKFNLDFVQGSIFKALYNCIKKQKWFYVFFRLINTATRLFSKKIYLALRIQKKLRSKYDVAIAFRPGICADIVLYTINASSKICWWHHGSLKTDTPEEMVKKQFCEFDKIVTVSKGALNLLGESFPELKSKIVIVPNIINRAKLREKEDLFSPYKNDYLSPLVSKIVSVSRLTSDKSVITVVEVAKLLRDNGFQFKWHIIGDGECANSIRDRIRQYNLDSMVLMEDIQINPYPWIKDADIFVHVSPIESFGIVILEAMALDTPCIAVNSIGAQNLINGTNGICTVSDPEYIAEEIMRLSKDKERYNMIIRNARATVDEYSPKKVFKQFEKIVLR